MSTERKTMTQSEAKIEAEQVRTLLGGQGVISAMQLDDADWMPEIRFGDPGSLSVRLVKRAGGNWDISCDFPRDICQGDSSESPQDAVSLMLDTLVTLRNKINMLVATMPGGKA